jgi:hypothetical protein
MKNLTNKSVMAAVAIATCGLAASAVPAFADPLTTLANFKVDDASLGGGNSFSFTNAGASSTLTTIGDSVAVDFSYTVAANTYNGAAGVNIPAILTLTSSVAGLAASAGGTDAQPLTDVVLTVTAKTPVGGKSNLFSVVFSDPGIPSDGLTYGHNGTQTATLKGDNGGASGENVFLTSDFLDLTGATREGFGVEFTNVTPGLSIAGNGYLSSFTSQGAGQFEANAGTGQNRTPEPASLMTLGLGAVGLLIRRRRSIKA